MPKFGKRSRGNMKGVDVKLQNVFNEVVKDFDCTVTEGVRSQERQDVLVAQGKSKTKFGKQPTKAKDHLAKNRGEKRVSIV